MMLKRLFLLALTFAAIAPVGAQNMRKVLKKRTAEACVYGNLGYYGNPHWGAGTNIHYLHGIGRKRQTFSVGMGMRANLFFTKKRDYTTSSDVLSALNPGRGGDTLYMPEVQTNTLNAYVAMKIFVKRGVFIHINTDIGGINFGDKQKAFFRSYETNPLPPGREYNTEPYAFNLQVPGKESYGTIMTEVYGSFKLSDVLYWRLGLNYLRNEYKVDRLVYMNGTRFSQNNWMVMSGLAFDIRWHKTVEQARFSL